jgi:hypothetical protein
MRRNPIWRALGAGKYDHDGHLKKLLYGLLRQEYRLSEFDSKHIVQTHWRRSGWLPDHIDSRACDALGAEIWTHVKADMYRKAGEPGFKPSAQRSVMEGNNPKGGLHYQAGEPGHPGRIHQTTRRMKKHTPLGGKELDVPTDWSHMPRARREYYLTRQKCFRQAKLVVITESSGRERVEAHLVFDCPAYRAEEYMNSVNKTAMVSFDMGPSSVAWISYDPTDDCYDSGTYRLDQQERKRINTEGNYRKQRQKAQARSRRNTNPDCYEENDGKKQGKHIRGKRIHTRSKRHQRDGRNIQGSWTREEKIKTTSREQITREIMSKGTNIITEKDVPKDWQQKGYGSSIQRYSPGELRSRIIREAKRMDGTVIEHNTYETCLSQYCLCGNKVKKPTEGKKRVHVHQCQNPECPLYGYTLDRDLFAAFLGLLTHRYSTEELISGKLASEHWVTAVEYCSTGSVVAPSGVEPATGEMSTALGVGGEAAVASRQSKVTGINDSTLESLSNQRRGSLSGEDHQAPTPRSRGRPNTPNV